MVALTTSLDTLCVNSIRMLAVDAINKSKSGHPGLPMGCAPMGYALWDKHLRHNPKNPKWFNRDRFVLSAGHGCMLLYALLHLTGYDSVTIEDIKEFRQWGAKTPGHPETFETPGVEVTAGPLGAGISNAVGLAIAEAHLSAKFNKPDSTVVDHYTYVLMGDGCNQEGISSEACSLAGHLKLGKLIALYDDNHITIDGRTDVSFTEDVLKRYEAYGWHVQEIPEGEAIAVNLREMFRLIDPIIATVIGEGGSGGALGIGVADRLLMFEHSVYTVASPEACASILWRDAGKAPEAASSLKITGPDLMKLGIVDEVLKEPSGGNNWAPLQAGDTLKNALEKHLSELLALSPDELRDNRYSKFRKMGKYLESQSIESEVSV